MTNMKEALIELQVLRDNIDENIVLQHEAILGKERDLATAKEGLRILQERSASLSETIKFVQAGMQNELKLPIVEESSNG